MVYSYNGTLLSNKKEHGNSLVVQWLGLCAFTAGAQVQSLVGELRTYKLRSVAKLKKKKTKKTHRKQKNNKKEQTTWIDDIKRNNLAESKTIRSTKKAGHQEVYTA